MGVCGDGGGVLDAAEGEAGDDSAGVAFHDGFEVGGVVKEVDEELGGLFQGEELVGCGCGLRHEFVDEFSLAAPCVCLGTVDQSRVSSERREEEEEEEEGREDSD